MEPIFFWKDLTGRGETGEFCLSSLQDFTDEDVNDDDIPLEEWLKDAWIGDEWKSSTDYYIRIH